MRYLLLLLLTISIMSCQKVDDFNKLLPNDLLGEWQQLTPIEWKTYDTIGTIIPIVCNETFIFSTDSVIINGDLCFRIGGKGIYNFIENIQEVTFNINSNFFIGNTPLTQNSQIWSWKIERYHEDSLFVKIVNNQDDLNNGISGVYIKQ